MPLDPKLTKFTTASEALLNVDAKDIATGTSYITYYLTKTVDKNLLVQNAYYSDRVLTATQFSSDGKIQDLDFDVTFEKNITIEGETVANIASGVGWAAGATPITFSTQIRLSVIHVDAASAETVLVSNVGTINSVTTSNEDFSYTVAAIDLDIPKTQFKKGETLRLTVENWGTVSSSKDAFAITGHDPQNRATSDFETNDNAATPAPITFDTNPSISTFQIPIKVDT